MASWIHTVLHNLAQRRRVRRRRVNVRQHLQRPPRADAGTPLLLRLRMPAATPALWMGGAGLLAFVAGAVLIAGHARYLRTAAAAGDKPGVALFLQPVLPGASFMVPMQPGLSMEVKAGAALLVATGLAAQKTVRVDLCSQLLDPAKPRLSPLRIGYRFDDVARWVTRNQTSAAPMALHNVLLVQQPPVGTPAMPQLQISGDATADFNAPLQLDWSGAPARWVSDASLGQIVDAPRAQVTMLRQGWLSWGGSALRIERRTSAACPQAGELLLQMFHPSADETAPARPAKALVVAFPAHGAALAGAIAPGFYQVPAAPRASLEDQDLFNQLLAHGLLRLGDDGGAELAPRDLALWRAASNGARAADLAAWDGVTLDGATVKLLKRLYWQADGAYLRQQVDVFNGELRLLAWRVVADSASASDWQASVDGAAAAPVAAMPMIASRLFADLPQGWAPWQRLARWPHASLTLPVTPGAAPLRLMLAGRVTAVDGALLHAAPICDGRACPAPSAVQVITLTPLPGARSVRLDVAALDASSLKGQKDQQYRHLRVAGGKLAWQALDNNGAPNAKPRAPSPVVLQDRDGALLWADGAATAAALDAGLAPLLGLGPDHTNSVAGMLGRLLLPSTARLSIDVALQTLSQHVLDCIGMRRGRWDDQHGQHGQHGQCSGGQAAPDGRRAGIVFIDAENGDILAAAGAGGASVTATNWREVRDFDQANPARSPLRLPALQHDGGAHQSPGSTFKVISALGLEMAARTDPRIDALLGGLLLADIDRMARQRGFGFQTDAATYPFSAGAARGAYITNYREQSLRRRAEDGRLGLAQALTYSLNTWFAWSAELSDRSLFGRPDGGAPDLQALDPEALDALRPILASAHNLGFEQALRLDGGLLPPDFAWAGWDALQTTAAHIDTIHTRHELRQMAIGLRMQATPLQMALAAAAIGQGAVVAPRLLLALDGRDSQPAPPRALEVRLDRIRAGMKGVIEVGTGAGAFGGPALAPLRHGLYGKTGTAPTSVTLPDGSGRELATVWFTGWLEPGSLPGRPHRIAMAAFVSHSDGSGGEHAAPVVAAVLASLLAQSNEQKGK